MRNDELMREALGKATPGNSTVAMALADTEYSYAIPDKSRNVSFRLKDLTVAWRWSMTAGEVAAGGGYAMAAGEEWTWSGPVAAATIYFASPSASMTMNVAREAVISRTS